MSSFSSKGAGTSKEAANYISNAPGVFPGTISSITYKEVGANKTPQFLVTVETAEGAAQLGLWASEKALPRTLQEFNRMGDKILGSMSKVEAIEEEEGSKYAEALETLFKGKPAFWVITVEVNYIPLKGEDEGYVSRWEKPVVYPFAAVHASQEDAQTAFDKMKADSKFKDGGIPSGLELKPEKTTNTEGAGTANSW